MTDIRTATEDDRPLLERFMARLQEVERALHESRLPGAEMAAAHTASLLARAREQDGCVLIAEVEGAAVGFLIGWVETEDGHFLRPSHARVGWITDIFVDEAARGTGAVDALMAAAEEHFRARGVETLMLALVEGNEPAARAYSRLGYRPYERILEKPLTRDADETSTATTSSNEKSPPKRAFP